MRRLKLKLFGGFSLGDEFAEINEITLHSKKILRLLVYILLNRHEVLSQRDLMNSMWEGRVGNPEGSLKNLMYRLRVAMKPLGDEEFINTMPRAYRWNPAIKVEVDCEEFERLDAELRALDSQDQEHVRPARNHDSDAELRTLDAQNQERRRELCLRIIEMYQGNVTPLISDEIWILTRVVHYRAVYAEAARILCGIYGQERDWDSLEQLCERALPENPLDEDLCCGLLKAMYGQGKYALILLRYEKIREQFYESTGNAHPEKVDALIRKLMVGKNTTEMDLGNFIEDAGTQEKNGNVFFCDYQTFRKFYQIETYRIDRLGLTEYMMLVTVRRNSNFWRDPSEDEELQKGVRVMERLLRRQLRSGDVVTQCSPTQYIAILPGCTCESGVLLARRIKEQFKKEQFKKGTGLQKLSVLSELAEIRTAGLPEAEVLEEKDA